MVKSNEVLANLVLSFHIFVISFIVIVPFLDVPPSIYILHIISCICLFVHWASNSDVCCLTVLEGNLRGVHRSETLTHQFISPVYKISTTEWNNIVWLFTFALMCVSIYKLCITDKFKKSVKCMMSEKLDLHNFMKCIRPLFV